MMYTSNDNSIIYTTYKLRKENKEVSGYTPLDRTQKQ